MKILLDTNAYSAMRQGHEGVLSRIRDATKVVMSTVVLGELLYGFHHGTRYRLNLVRLEAFLIQPHIEIRPVTRATADHFGQIAAALRRQGQPIPSNDIWIAAHALETEAELLSFDSHFRRVEGLRWADLRV